MANGTYGITMPAFITPNDCDIFYHFRTSRATDSSDFSAFKKIDSQYLSTVNFTDDDGNNNVLPGMYNLRLPLNIFNQKGIYTVYIKPKEIYGKIVDVSSLSVGQDIKGIVISANGFDTDNQSVFENGNLVGYRVEYFNDNDERENYYRLITSNYKCSPVAQNYTDTTVRSVRYMYNDLSNLIFCTLTPSVNMSFVNDASYEPYIGKTNQKIALINTKFSPFAIEIEMVDHDIESISTMLEGSQIRNLDEGTITTFTDDGGIYHQAVYGTITNTNEGIHHDFKVKKDSDITNDEKTKFDKIKENYNN